MWGEITECQEYPSIHLPEVYKAMKSQLQPLGDNLGLKQRRTPLTVGKHQVFGFAGD